MIQESDVIKTYEYFYKKIYSTEKYKYKPSEKAIKTIHNFLKLLDKKYNLQSIGTNFLYNYFLFQFDYWSKLEIEAFYGTMQIDYIIGKKAFTRFIQRNQDFDYMFAQYQIISQYQLRYDDIVIYKKQIKTNETLKWLYHNLDRGLDTCIKYTTLYEPHHTSCITCNFKADCKKILRDNYPKLYDKRLGTKE